MMKIKKNISFILTFLTITIMMKIPVFADDVSGMYSNLKPDGGLSKVGNPIVSIISTVAVACAIVGTIVLGIRYVYSAPGEKAEVKKKLIPWAIGLVLIFAAVGLVNLVYTISQGLF